jgi:glycosidase
MSTFTKIEEKSPLKLAEADLKPRGRVFPSPVNWRDQIFYQLLPDRFSDGRENERPCFDPEHPEQYRAKEPGAWMSAGNRFIGGTLKGVQSKLDYLQNLGVTALWINPPWKQRLDLQTYHGYGIQNFLEIDPHFGSRQDLRDLVDAAHDRGMYVILDVIFNHTGNNWFYLKEETGEPRDTRAYRFSPPYPVHGWRSASGESIPKPLTPEDGVWPVEFQNLDFYTRAGMIGKWSIDSWEDPMGANVEFRRGDFYDLKNLEESNKKVNAQLAEVFQYWIALSDCDGFRLDAVKHISLEGSRRFCTAVHDFAESIGKENFFITGEITDNTIAPGYVDLFGRDLDAVLGIVAFPNKLAGLVKGTLDPQDFYSLLRADDPNNLVLQLGRFVVLVLDDHDMSSRSKKERFSAHGVTPNVYHQIAHAVGVQLTVPGIPAIYYGSEQAFDGSEDYHDYSAEPKRYAEDRYVREGMFGGSFGAFGTQGCHFFNPNHPSYLRIAAIARLRNGKDRVGRTLRRGLFYPRQTAYLDYPFGLQKMGELAAYSMIHVGAEVLAALNTHALEGRSAYVTVDEDLHPQGSTMTFLYRSDWSNAALVNPPAGETVEVVHNSEGRAMVKIDLPPAGMAILT